MRAAALLAVLLALASCRTGVRLTDDGSAPAAVGSNSAPARVDAGPSSASTARGGVVSLTAADLAPVDTWLRYKTNPQWILGDEVEVVASREYFATALTINTPTTGIVTRTDDVQPTETVVTLRFRGARSQAGVQTSPRVLVGDGLTITARRILRVRLQKTSDPSTPVHLRVSASGEAARGVRDKVVERAAALTIGGTLRRRGGGYAWDVIGGR